MPKVVIATTHKYQLSVNSLGCLTCKLTTKISVKILAACTFICYYKLFVDDIYKECF